MEEIKGSEGSHSGFSSPSFPDSPANDQRRSKTEDLRMSTSFKAAQEQATVRNIQHIKTSSADSFDDLKEANVQKGIIDTAAPFESVRAAVSKFGALLDRKSPKVAAAEKSKHVQAEPENLEEIMMYKQQLEVAEDARAQVLEELDRTKRLIQELKLSLEKIETEEAQAKQDSELAHLRVREMEQGISDDDSPAAKAQVEILKTRHETAVKELESVGKELASLQGDYQRLLTERDLAVARADEAVLVYQDIEKKVEGLTHELAATKEALESAHSSHFAAEETRMCTTWARDQEKLDCEKELKEAESEMQHLTEQLSIANDLKFQYDTKSSLLFSLKSELAAYMDGKVAHDCELAEEESEAGMARTSIRPALVSAKKELHDVRTNIEKAKDEVNCLRDSSSSFKSELDRETEALAALRQREEMAAVTVSSLEAELSRMQSELELSLTKEKEARDKMEDLSKAMQQATKNADQAKSAANSAREELKKAKAEVQQAKAGAGAVETRLLAAVKEIEAAKVAEEFALGTTKAMQESEEKQNSFASSDSEGVITLSAEEYYTLSKNAHDAEEAANMKVISAIEQIKDAKKSELSSLERLDAAHKLLEEKKAALSAALGKEEKASEAKTCAEQEMRDWRAQNELRRTASDADAAGTPSMSSSGSLEESDEAKGPAGNKGASHHMSTKSEPVISYSNDVAPEAKTKRKKSFFPRIVMFLARKKVQTLK